MQGGIEIESEDFCQMIGELYVAHRMSTQALDDFRTENNALRLELANLKMQHEEREAGNAED